MSEVMMNVRSACLASLGMLLLSGCSCSLCHGTGWQMVTYTGRVPCTTDNIRKHGRSFSPCVRCNRSPKESRSVCETCRGTGRDPSATRKEEIPCPDSEGHWVSEHTHSVYFNGWNLRYSGRMAPFPGLLPEHLDL